MLMYVWTRTPAVIMGCLPSALWMSTLPLVLSVLLFSSLSGLAVFQLPFQHHLPTLRAHVWCEGSTARTGWAGFSKLSPLFCHVTGDPLVAPGLQQTLCLAFGGSCDRTSLILDAASCRKTAAPSCRGSAGSSGANCLGEEDCFGHNEGSVC